MGLLNMTNYYLNVNGKLYKWKLAVPVNEWLTSLNKKLPLTKFTELYGINFKNMENWYVIGHLINMFKLYVSNVKKRARWH